MKKRSLGKMRHLVQIMQTLRTDDGYGGKERKDVPGEKLYARVEILSAAEVIRYQHLQKNVTHRITMRANPDAKDGVAIRWLVRPNDPDSYIDLYVRNVIDPRPDRPGEWLELICREGGNL